MHPVLEKSVQIYQNVILLEDNRQIPKQFSISAKQDWAPFHVNLFYDGSSHLALAELSARFPDCEAASTGLRDLKLKSALPYSLFTLASHQIRALGSREKGVHVTISHKFAEEKTLITLCQ